MSERNPERTPRPRRSLALGMGRMAENCTQKELSATSGIPDKEISALETKREPDREQLERLFAAMGRESEEVDVALFCADLLRDPEGALPESPVEPTREEVRRLRVAAALEAVEVFRVTYEQLVQALRQEKARAFREEAEALWQELRTLPPRERWRRVEESEAYRTWALAERTALESEKKAADDADAAVDLARLAVRMAERAPESEEWRSRSGGLCWGFLGNALRVKSDLPEAERSFLRSDRLWKEGAAADPGLILDGTRLLDLKASLRRTQGRFQESLDLVEDALALSRSDECTLRLLLKKSATHEQMGDWPGAIEALERARPLMEKEKELRPRFNLEFNLSASLLDAGRCHEAQELLPRVRGLALQLGNGLDVLRVRWLQARTSAAQARREEAVADLEYVVRELVLREIPFDAARACLDLTGLYLEQGRSIEVQRLARQMVEVFKAQRVPANALAAVIVFRKAAEQQRVTGELVRRLADYLRRAERDPGVSFEP